MPEGILSLFVRGEESRTFFPSSISTGMEGNAEKPDFMQECQIHFDHNTGNLPVITVR